MGEDKALGEAFGKVATWDLLRSLISEFFCTAGFISLSTMSTMSPGGEGGPTHLPLDVAFAHGLIIFILVSIAASVSGGHLNPSVTIGAMVSKACPIGTGIVYIPTQLLGGIIGSLVTRLLVTGDIFTGSNGGATMPSENVNIAQALGLEVVLTFWFVLTVLMVAVDKEGKAAQPPLTVGCAITALALAGGFFSGGSMNTARSIGPQIVMLIFHGTSLFGSGWIYFIGPPLGGALAGIFYRGVMGSKEQRFGGKEDKETKQRSRA